MRTTGSSHEKTKQAIRQACIELISERGFAATSLRDLARRVGLQPGSIYNYIQGKEDLLYFLIKETLDARLEELRERLAGAAGDPLAEIRAYVELNVEFHSQRRREMIIGSTELKSLSAERYATIVATRDAYDGILTDIVRRGVAAGVFKVEDARIATFAIIAMISGISNWFRAGGRLSAEEVARLYTAMVLRVLGAPEKG